jgi:hypothetical protein
MPAREAEGTMPEVSSALRERFRAHADDPAHREAVIITLRSREDAGQLARAGVAVERIMRGVPIVSCRLDAAALGTLEGMDGVVRIELDGEVRAIDD